MNLKLGETFAKSTPTPTRQQIIHYDTELTGFGLRVTKAGAKSFVLNYTLAGQEHRLTIGRYPAWSVAAARDEAKRLRRLVDQGKDPLASREEARKAPTIKNLWEAYEREHLPKLAKRAQADVRSMWNKRLIPEFGTTKVAELTSQQVDHLHKLIASKKPVRANRVIELLRKALNLAIRWGWIEKNPALGFHRSPEHPRSTYLDREQIKCLVSCLDAMENQQAANVIRLLLHTGARLGEVLQADWSQFDLVQGVWTKPSSATKQRRIHRVPLSTAALKLLQEMAESRTAFFLFPNSKGTKPVADINAEWRDLRKQAGIPAVRLHDLRHTFASILVSSGESLPVIGRLLGHAQAQTTMRYAHLMDDPLRVAADKVAQVVSPTSKPADQAGNN